MKNQPYRPEKYKKMAVFDDAVKFAESEISKGNVIEGFVILHSILEAELSTSWIFFLYQLRGKKVITKNDMDKNWSYNDCVELLHQIGFLTKNEKSIFQNFKKERNAVVHDMLNPIKQDTLTEKTLITQFKAGLQAHKIAKRMMMKGIKN